MKDMKRLVLFGIASRNAQSPRVSGRSPTLAASSAVPKHDDGRSAGADQEAERRDQRRHFEGAGEGPDVLI